MKIYFAAPLQNIKIARVVTYGDIIEVLKKYGDILTEKIGDANFQLQRKKVNVSCSSIHDFDLSLIFKADLIIAEITSPSLGVGYEIGRSRINSTPLLGLYNKRIKKLPQISRMIRGVPGIKIIGYTSLSDLSKQIKAFFEKDFLQGVDNERL